MRGTLKLARLFVAYKLIDGVEVERLNAVSLVKLVARKARVDLLGNTIRAAVTVSNRGEKILAVLVKKKVINAPGVDSDGVGERSELLALGNSLDD